MPFKPTEPSEKLQEVSEEKRKEKEAIRQRIEEEKETKAQVFQARTELKGLRKVGKIDLEQKPEDKPEPKTRLSHSQLKRTIQKK